MSGEVETMAWRHEVPWHGMGTEVRGDQTVEEWQKLAGLDWSVRMLPAAAISEGGSPIMVKNRNCITRSTDNKVFDIVSDHFIPVQNADVVKFFKHFCDAGNATMETLGALKGGKVIWGLANLKTGFNLPGNDPVKGYLLLTTRHEAGYATIAATTAIRVVCANTFRLAFRSANHQERMRVSHMQEFDPEVAAAGCSTAREQMSEFEKNAKLLQKLNIGSEDVVKILAPIYQPETELKELQADYVGKANRTVKGIIEAARNGAGSQEGTGWGLFNGVTYWSNHLAGGDRFYSATMDKNSTRATKVFDKLLEMAS